MAQEDHKHKIGWNLPEGDDQPCPSGLCHPSAPELPRVHIPNSTAPVGFCGTKDQPKFSYGSCVPPPEVALQEHILGRPINAFLAPSNKTATELPKNEFWVKGSKGSIPAGAVQGGQEASGEPLYVCRAEYKGSLTPGKLSASGGCHISWGSAEHRVDDYEVLCNLAGRWERVARDKVPDNALQGGYSESGEILFVGRAKHHGNLTPGKVQKSHQVCYVPFGGKEVSYQAFEVFVVDN